MQHDRKLLALKCHWLVLYSLCLAPMLPWCKGPFRLMAQEHKDVLLKVCTCWKSAEFLGLHVTFFFLCLPPLPLFFHIYCILHSTACQSYKFSIWLITYAPTQTEQEQNMYYFWAHILALCRTGTCRFGVRAVEDLLLFVINSLFKFEHELLPLHTTGQLDCGLFNLIQYRHRIHTYNWDIWRGEPCLYGDKDSRFTETLSPSSATDVTRSTNWSKHTHTISASPESILHRMELDRKIRV